MASPRQEFPGRRAMNRREVLNDLAVSNLHAVLADFHGAMTAADSVDRRATQRWMLRVHAGFVDEDVFYGP